MDRRRIHLLGVSGRDRVDHIYTFDYLPKHAVFVVKPGCGYMRDKELRAVRAGAGVCHGKHAGFVMAQAGMKFISEAISRTPATCTRGIAALYHKIGNDPVEEGAIKETLPGEKNKIVHRFGGFIGKEIELDIPFIRMQYCSVFLLRVDG